MFFVIKPHEKIKSNKGTEHITSDRGTSKRHLILNTVSIP